MFKVKKRKVKVRVKAGWDVLFPVFKIQVISMAEIKCPGDFRIFQSALAVRLQKKQLPKAQQKPLYIMLAMPSAYIIILPMTMIWFFNSWNYLFYLNYIVYLKHILTGDTRQYLSPRSPCFGFFVCPCYSRSIQYLMLQDPKI